MEQATNQLSEEEVRQRLNVCSNPQTVDELYNFGQMLVKGVREDIQHIELKAASLAAYSGAIVTLLVSSSGSWSKFASGWMALATGAAALSAAICCVVALSLGKFEWFSQKEWLEDSCFGDLQELKRFRILTMWGVIKSYRDAHTTKVCYLRVAQWALAAAIALLLVALGAGLWSFYVSHNLRLPWW